MGAAAMAFFNAVSGVARQPLNPQQGPPPSSQGPAQGHPLAPPLGMGPIPGSRSARRHYQQQLQQLQGQLQGQLQANNKQQLQARKQQGVVSAPRCAPGPSQAVSPLGQGPSRVAEEPPQTVVAPAPNRCPCTVDEFLAPFRSKMRAFKKLRKRLG